MRNGNHNRSNSFPFFPTCISNMDVPYLYIEAATIQELRNEHDHYVIADWWQTIVNNWYIIDTAGTFKLLVFLTLHHFLLLLFVWHVLYSAYSTCTGVTCKGMLHKTLYTLSPFPALLSFTTVLQDSHSVAIPSLQTWRSPSATTYLSLQ